VVARRLRIAAEVGTVEQTVMANKNHKKDAHMATSSAEQKSAMDTLLDSMDELVDSAAKRMTPEELRKARKEINDW
jgi:hypothetical protein